MSVDHRMNTIIYYRIDYKVLLVLLVFMHINHTILFSVFYSVMHCQLAITFQPLNV